MQFFARFFRGAASERSYRACSLGFSRELAAPDPLSIVVEQLRLEDPFSEDYHDRLAELRGESESKACHHLLGYPDSIQGSYMETECAGIQYDPQTATPAQVAELLTWRLLFQVDSDDNAGFMFGDLGSVYYFIRAEDLQQRNFTRVRAIEQCY